MICYAVHAAVGWSVIAKWTTRSTLMCEQHEDEQHASSEGRDREEVHRDQGCCVIGQERSPRLGGRTKTPSREQPLRAAPRPRCPLSAIRHGFECSPERICGRHPVHKCAMAAFVPGRPERGRFERSARSAAEPLAMPPQHRRWLHDHQGGAPPPPRVGEQDPKEPICWAELRAFTDTRQRGQLLTKPQVLKGNRSVSSAVRPIARRIMTERCQHA